MKNKIKTVCVTTIDSRVYDRDTIVKCSAIFVSTKVVLNDLNLSRYFTIITNSSCLFRKARAELFSSEKNCLFCECFYFDPWRKFIVLFGKLRFSSFSLK